MRFNSFIHNSVDLHNAYLDWQNNPQNQRFGQWLYNRYINDDKPWPELFYKDHGDAYAVALSHIQQELVY